MAFCSYCGNKTEGVKAVCNGCLAKRAAHRSRPVTTSDRSRSSILFELLSSKALLSFGALLALGGVVFVSGPQLRGSPGDAPTAREVEPLVRAELLAIANNCTLAHFGEVSVGAYRCEMGGWPVYASHQTVCRSGSTTVTYDGLNNVKERVPVAYVRRGMTGSVQTFTPAIVKHAQERIDKYLEKINSTKFVAVQPR
jgi:hypothetical protein